jgi:hypothetical protein
VPFAESALCCEYAVNANVAATKAVRQDRSKIRMLLPRRMGCATHLAAKTGTDLFFPRKRGRTERGRIYFSPKINPSPIRGAIRALLL